MVSDMVGADTRLARSRAQVRDAIAEHGGASRTQLAALTGLAPATVARALRGLLDDGSVLEVPASTKGRSARGRPATRLVPAGAHGFVIGLDIGHTRITAGLGDGHGALVGELSARIAPTGGTARLRAMAAHAVRELLSRTATSRDEILRTVVTVPAPIDPVTGDVADAPIVVEHWRGTRPASLLEEWLDLPVVATNDANAAALAEYTYGSGQGAGDLVYLHATTGVGAGLVLGGRMYTGGDGGAGEIGHIRLHEATDLCRCGQRGCLESEASVSALLAKMHAVGVPVPEGRAAEDVIRMHAADPVVARLLIQAGSALGSVVADMCNVLSPDVVVIGGELAAGGDAVVAGVRRSIHLHALSTVSDKVRIELASLGSRGAMVGAMTIASESRRAVGSSAGVS